MEVVKSSTQLINWFRNSAPYINAHRHKTFVLMLGGEALETDNFQESLMISPYLIASVSSLFLCTVFALKFKNNLMLMVIVVNSIKIYVLLMIEA